MAQTSPSSLIPAMMLEQEGRFTGVWLWTNGHFEARWDNGAIATITVETFTPQSVVLNRKDTIGSSPGLTAVYTGQISSQGNGIANGKATFTWPGHFATPPTGTWNATWGTVPDCGANSLLPSPPGTPYLCNDDTLPFNYSKNKNYHHYEDLTTVCQAQQSPNCTLDNVFAILLQTPRAIAPVTTSVTPDQIKSCAIIQLRSCPNANNQIRIVIDATQHSVTNYTLPSHLFYPGQVTRQIIDQNGTIGIKTIGEGVGCSLAPNLLGGFSKIWPDADEALRAAVWAKFGLGQPPPIPSGLLALRLFFDAVMGICDTL